MKCWCLAFLPTVLKDALPEIVDIEYESMLVDPTLRETYVTVLVQMKYISTLLQLEDLMFCFLI